MRRCTAALLVSAAVVGAPLLGACGTAEPVAAPPTVAAAPEPGTGIAPGTGIGTATGSDPGDPGAAGPDAGSGAADGTDLAACTDGTCEVAVREGSTIAFDDSVGVGRLTVTTVDDDRVGVEARTGPGSRAAQTSSVGSRNTLNGLSYRVLSVRDGVAVVDFSTT